MKELIAMLYLTPTKGVAAYLGEQEFIDRAMFEASKIFNAGFNSLLIENEFDHPYSILASNDSIESMTKVCKAIKSHYPAKRIGVEFLLNDPKASLLIAKNSDLDFIRTDYFVDPMSREEYGGEMNIIPDELMEYRIKIKAENIKIYTDIQVKYAKMLIDRSIKDSCILAKEKKSDGLIISSHITGIGPAIDDLKQANIGNIPVIVGSGLSISNLETYFPYFDMAIVGSSIMEDGIIVESKAKQLVEKFNDLSK